MGNGFTAINFHMKHVVCPKLEQETEDTAEGREMRLWHMPGIQLRLPKTNMVSEQ